MCRVSHSVCLLALLLYALPSQADIASRPDTRAYNIAHGRVVFENSCMRCHESGRKGAPILGDVEDWRERLQQPLDTLIAHAISGHGRMPARGDQQISDQDIAAAVAFVVDRTRTLMRIEDINGLPPPAVGGATQTLPESLDEAVVQMFLMLLGKDRWK